MLLGAPRPKLAPAAFTIFSESLTSVEFETPRCPSPRPSPFERPPRTSFAPCAPESGTAAFQPPEEWTAGKPSFRFMCRGRVVRSALSKSAILTRFAFLALAGLLSASPANAAGFADAIISYKPGTGFATEFGSGLGFTNTAAVLGEPSRIIPGQFGGPVDPFNPPYLREQLVSIGAGGSLTVRLDAPALNLPGNPFGIDFMIFGNAGFTITNANFIGGGITDGSLFGANSGDARVFVSTDNVEYFLLSPSLAPGVDRYFPTDGAGDFSRPLNPALQAADFSGRDLAGIRSLYGGSGGGAGFDLGWALDANGRSVNLTSIRFVRIDVLSGAAEIDAIVAVPEPSSWALGLLGFGLLLARPNWRLSKVE